MHISQYYKKYLGISVLILLKFYDDDDVSVKKREETYCTIN